MTTPCRNRSAGTPENVGWRRSIGTKDARKLGEAMRGIGHKAAGMRQDNADSEIPVHYTVQDELDGRSGGIKWVVDERTGDASHRRQW
jgi:hypothetical protein